MQCIKKLLLVTVLVLMPFAVVAQQCDSARSAQYEKRFDYNKDGTVTDIESGLTWMRCTLGQQWESNMCTGQAEKLTWYEAVNRIDAINKKSTTRWRLPRLNELASIVDIGCKSPRINLNVFPDTGATSFWTFSAAPDAKDVVYILGFGHDGVSKSSKKERHFVRPVIGRD